MKQEDKIFIEMVNSENIDTSNADIELLNDEIIDRFVETRQGFDRGSVKAAKILAKKFGMENPFEMKIESDLFKISKELKQKINDIVGFKGVKSVKIKNGFVEVKTKNSALTEKMVYEITKLIKEEE